MEADAVVAKSRQQQIRSEEIELAFSLRNRREHKAWGISPKALIESFSSL